MSHRVHPYAHRLGIIRDWKSRWFGLDKKYTDSLKSDIVIREYLEKELRGMYLGNIEIERSEKILKVIIETSRPGLIIGRSGEGVTKIKNGLEKLLAKRGLPAKQELRVDIKEIRSPESNARVVAWMIVEGLEKRMPYRRVIKQALDKVMANRDAKGIKIIIGGRLGGAEISRTEKFKKGQIPLQTFRADIDYAHEEARLTYGTIGVRVWIYRGEIFDNKKK